MAAAPKPKPKAGGGSGIGPIPWVIISVLGILAVVVFLGQGVRVSEGSAFPTYLNVEFLFYRIVKLLEILWGAIVNGGIFNFFSIVLGIIGVLMAVLIAYTYLRIKEIEDAKHHELEKEGIEPEPVVQKQNERWESIERHMDTESEAEWRQAILEADIILDDMVARMGYKGENLGERLKNIEPSDFKTLQNAWEAHKVRNRIAHEGSEYVLSRHEAKRVIELYKSVFQEFEYI